MEFLLYRIAYFSYISVVYLNGKLVNVYRKCTILIQAVYVQGFYKAYFKMKHSKRVGK